MLAQKLTPGVAPQPTDKFMSLWACLKYWWQCRRLRREGTFGDYLCVPPNADDVRVIHKPRQEGISPETVGVKWKVKPRIVCEDVEVIRVRRLE